MPRTTVRQDLFFFKKIIQSLYTLLSKLVDFLRPDVTFPKKCLPQGLALLHSAFSFLAEKITTVHFHPDFIINSEKVWNALGRYLIAKKKKRHGRCQSSNYYLLLLLLITGSLTSLPIEKFQVCEVSFLLGRVGRRISLLETRKRSVRTDKIIQPD